MTGGRCVPLKPNPVLRYVRALRQASLTSNSLRTEESIKLLLKSATFQAHYHLLRTREFPATTLNSLSYYPCCTFFVSSPQCHGTTTIPQSVQYVLEIPCLI